MNERRRVMITGIGLMTPGADSIAKLWERVIRKEPYVSRIQELEGDASILLKENVMIAGAKFGKISLKDYLKGRIAFEERYDTTTKLAMISAQRAVEDSGIGCLPKDTMVIIGSARGNAASLETKILEVFEGVRTGQFQRPMHVRGMSLTSASTIAPAVSRWFGLQGVSNTVSSACTSSLSAIKQAYDYILFDESDTALAGGAEAALTLPVYVWFHLVGLYTSIAEDPSKSVRPFCSTREGTAIGEAGCILLLEERNHALARGARIYGEVLAASVGIDPAAGNFESMSEDGIAYGELIKKTIARANMDPREMDLVAAHAPGTIGDTISLRALDHAFEGQLHPPTVSFMSITGHTIGACDALKTSLALYSMDQSIVPPNSNSISVEKVSDQQNIPLVPETGKSVNAVLVLGSGFGGQMGAIVIRKYEAH